MCYFSVVGGIFLYHILNKVCLFSMCIKTKMRSLNYASDAWKCLNGIFCVYKPSGLASISVRNTLCFNLCRDLNDMEHGQGSAMVCLKGSVYLRKSFEIEVVPNYAHHELVSGPYYQEQDIRMKWLSALGKYTSGILLMAINDGCKHLKSNFYAFLRKYEVKGKFGIATSNFMSDGIVVERSTYSHVKQASLDRVLASIQASHQSLAYDYAGVDIGSQAAYELASSGHVYPSMKTDPLIYSIKCSEFNLPHFTLEIQCVNENELFLSELVHTIGVNLRTTAACLQLRRVQFGNINLTHALLRKHWTLENIINNIPVCGSLLNLTSCSNKSFHKSVPIYLH